MFADFVSRAYSGEDSNKITKESMADRYIKSKWFIQNQQRIPDPAYSGVGGSTAEMPLRGEEREEDVKEEWAGSSTEEAGGADRPGEAAAVTERVTAKVCVDCEGPARWSCPECQVLLCEGCDDEWHEQNSEHERDSVETETAEGEAEADRCQDCGLGAQRGLQHTEMPRMRHCMACGGKQRGSHNRNSDPQQRPGKPDHKNALVQAAREENA